VPRSPGRTGRPWLRLAAQVLTEDTHCNRCHRPLYPWLRSPHPLSSTVDHIIALADGGHPTDRANLAGMHRSCNLAKEHDRRRGRSLGTSRTW
jgi:5-methylcytosine-specific restriction endonuclease McrA